MVRMRVSVNEHMSDQVTEVNWMLSDLPTSCERNTCESTESAQKSCL